MSVYVGIDVHRKRSQVADLVHPLRCKAIASARRIATSMTAPSFCPTIVPESRL
jgi:hypothetical protein